MQLGQLLLSDCCMASGIQSELQTFEQGVGYAACLFHCTKMRLSLPLKSLSLFPLLFLHSNVGGYSTNEPNQLPTRGRPNAAVPRLSPVRRLKGPVNKLSAIVKSEHVVIIFYVVLTE